MSISHYLKTIGRGARGARSLAREQAEDLFAKILDGEVTDLEIGAFCLAMRIKGETPEEMAGFNDAARLRQSVVAPATSGQATVILPSYNGARKLPVLTALLGLLLAEKGIRVIVHGLDHDPGRTTVAETFSALGLPHRRHVDDVYDGVNFLPIDVFAPQLSKLLNVRKTVGLRNSAHSLVKILNPVAGRALVIGSYTHSAYAEIMAETYRLIGADAMLLRGIEGESVADARKIQQIDVFVEGVQTQLQEAEKSLLAVGPDWPTDVSAKATAEYIADVIEHRRQVPEPIARQVAHIEDTLRAMMSTDQRAT
ncbi:MULTISPECIES: DNA-binding protein YbiB [unclassified Rhizobium]|uniref:DNA-binding protein YbiB n=1 Tax=unclassified Rhizobium TaxID=2613769 RepID=UPI000DDC90A6